MGALLHDLRYALRGLARSPGFTAAVVATLALGIGANTTMFGVLDTLLLRPPVHVRDPGRVARVYFNRNFGEGATFTGSSTSFPSYESLKDAAAFSATAAWFDAQLSLGRGENAKPIKVRGVTASYFPLLGVRTAAGRFFTADEDKPGAAPVAVVSHRYWLRQMGGDSAFARRTLTIGRLSYAVIGVAPEGFSGADLEEPDVWLPLRTATPDLNDPEALTSRNWFWVRALVRLAPGQTIASAASFATLAERRAASASDRRRDTLTAVLLGPIQDARRPKMSGDAKVALWVGAVALAVLLVACANVANLLLARGLRRRREMAIRAGLGAGRGRLVRQLLVESLVLAVAGGAAALLVALWGGAAVRAFLLPGLPASTALIDPRVLAFTTGVAMLAGVVAGVVPAWQASRTDVSESLRSGGRDVTTTRGRLRGALVAAQLTLTLVLLVGAGLFVHSLRNAQRLDYGLDLDHVLEASVDAQLAEISRTDSPGGPSDPQSALYLRLLERVRANPAVASAAASVGEPYGWSHSTDLKASGRDSLPKVPSGGPYFNAVTADFFAATGTRIVRGRGILEADQAPGAPRVTVVGQTFARLVWPGLNPIGQCLYVNGNDSTCVQVVGVAQDARARGVTEAQTLMYYIPFGQHLVPPPINGLLIRTRGPARLAEAEVQRTLQRTEPNLPYVSVRSLAEAVAPQWRSWRLGATMFTAFGLLALVIAALGLYAVTSYGVGQRTQEIGVRIALGAQRAQVIRLVVAQSVRAAAIGAAIGLGAALVLGRAVAALLFDVKPADALSVLGAVATLLAVAAVAAWVPARRAAQIDPMEALRHE
jgi:putative ABC transport system permease protein